MLSKTVTTAISILRHSSRSTLLLASTLALCCTTTSQAQSPLTSFEDARNLQQNIFTLGADLHVHLRYFTPAQGWRQRDLTTIAGAPAAAPASAIASFKDDAQNQQHVLYEAANGHLYQLYSNNNASVWNVQDVTSAAGLPGAAVATPILSYADGGTSVQYVFYVGLNQHIYLMYWYNGWTGLDASAAANAVPAGTASQLAGFIEPQSHTSHIFYEGGDQHIHELYAGLNAGGIYTTDNTVSSNSIPAAAASSLAGDFDATRLQEHVYFIGMDQHVHHLQYNYSSGAPWIGEDATSLAGAVAPTLVSSLTSFEDFTRDERHVFYVGIDQHLHQLYRGTGAWSGQDVTVVASAPLSIPATPLTSFKDDPNNQQHALFFGTDTHLYHLYFGGQWSVQDLSSASLVPAL